MVESDSIKSARRALNLSQAEAARRAGVSLATWRRGETDLTTVGAANREKIRQAVAAALQPVDSWVPRFNARFRGDPLTPSQAHLLAMILTLNGESFHLEQASVWDDDVLGDLPDAALMLVAERPQWLRRFLATSHELRERIHHGELPAPKSIAEATALHIALTHSPPPRELSELSGLGYRKYPRDLEQPRPWGTIRRALTPAPLLQALGMLNSSHYAAHLLAPMLINGRLLTSPLHPDRWWEPWSEHAKQWVHRTTADIHPRPSSDELGACTDDDPSHSRSTAWGLFELLAEHEEDLDLLLGGLLRPGRIAQIKEDSLPIIVVETQTGYDLVIRVSCRDHGRSQTLFPDFDDEDPLRSAAFAWGLADLLQEQVSDLDEVFEGDLIRQRLTVAGGSVVILPDASGFDLLLSVVVQERTSARSAAVDAACTSWLEYRRELEDEIAAWRKEGAQG